MRTTADRALPLLAAGEVPTLADPAISAMAERAIPLCTIVQLRKPPRRRSPGTRMSINDPQVAALR